MKKLLQLLLIQTVWISSLAFSQVTGEAQKVKLSGYMFGDAFYNANAIVPANKDINGFNFRRVYVTTDYTINDKFSTRFRLETNIVNGSNTSVFIKDAWLKWKDLFKGSDLYVGVSPTPTFDVSEGAWGYRSLEKTTMDYFGIAPSRDLGIDLKGKLDEGGAAKYWLKVGDGSGNKPETDKYKRFYGLVELDPSGDLLITVYADYNMMPKKGNSENSAIVAAGFVNYKQGKTFSIAVEGFLKSQQNNYTPPNATTPETQSAFGLSFWARALLSDEVGIVGRYDTYDPNTNSTSTNDRQGLFIGALDFKVDPKVSMMPGVEIHTLEGATNSDITPRVTFFWQF